MVYADYQWFVQQDLSAYAGKWIAIINQRIIASGSNPGDVVREAKEKFPKNTPLLTKVRNKLAVL